MNECNLFLLEWRGIDSRYNIGIVFHKPCARLGVIMYVTLWVIICYFFSCMTDNLNNA